MKMIFILYKKEVRDYFNGTTAYIFLFIFLVLTNWLFFQNFFLFNQAEMRGYFSLLPWLFILLAPSLTMRLWAEERKSRTIELLLTLPVREIEVVLAKYLSGLTILATALILSLSLPLTIASLGDLDWGPVIGGYFGALLLGGVYLSVGLFASALTKNSLESFLVAAGLCFGLLIIGEDIVLGRLPSLFQFFLYPFGAGFHFNNIAKGIIDLRDLIYYFGVIILFLGLNLKVLDIKK